jgi:uncharacterized OB-fold protein
MAAPSDGIIVNGDSKPYWDAAREGRLVFKKCRDCGHMQFPPRHLCPKCWSEEAEWVQHSGAGTVHSFTIVHRAPNPAHAARVPYVLAMLELDDAPRMIANIIGEDALSVSMGDRVEVVFENRDGTALPQFRRAARSGREPS